MSACCSARGCDEFFNEKAARRAVRRYRKKGLDRAARRLVELIREYGVEGASVLEIGGGIGAIQLELLHAGAARATVVELSPAYRPHAERLFAEAGLVDRLEYVLADVARNGETVGAADVVVMHRVVCCYPDVDELVGAAASRAQRLLLLTYPPRNAVSRFVIAAENLFFRLTRSEFRVFAHPPGAVLEAAEERGLRVLARGRERVWLFAALERAR